MKLRPLITAAEGFPALERLAASAREELCLSFRIFDPRTRLRSPELLERGLTDWKALLQWVAGRGVAIRLLIADFDPVFASDLHRNAWRCASALADVLDGDIQVICAPHPHTAGPMWRLIMARSLRANLAALRREDPVRLTPLQRRAVTGQVTLRPVTLHQKFAIADRATCIIGGLDLDERRYDDPLHRRDSEQTWHDVSMAVEGHFASVLFDHFADCWNEAITTGSGLLSDGIVRIDTVARAQNQRDCQLVRTRSASRRGLGALAPQTELAEHEKILTDAFLRATRRIYIETQYFRHMPLADALAQAALANPALHLICVLPTEPDNVLFDGDRGSAARHAQALQVRALERIRDAFGDRLALLSPAQPWSAPQDAPGQVAGAAPVYLHSKVTLIDDAFAMVGSANLNGRSMRWDTEASVLFRDREAVADLWQRLRDKWLARDAEGDPDLAATWRQSALADAARDPDQRDGYLMPYPIGRNRRFARWKPIVPDALF